MQYVTIHWKHFRCHCVTVATGRYRSCFLHSVDFWNVMVTLSDFPCFFYDSLLIHSLYFLLLWVHLTYSAIFVSTWSLRSLSNPRGWNGIRKVCSLCMSLVSPFGKLSEVSKGGRQKWEHRPIALNERMLDQRMSEHFSCCILRIVDIRMVSEGRRGLAHWETLRS